MLPETTLSEEQIFKGKLLTLNLRQAQLADGTAVQREIISTRGAVVIVPLTANNEVRLVKQFRAGVEDWVIELPAGTLESGENPDLAAPRELLEETGDQAATWHKLGGFYSAPGILTEYLHLYLATGLTPGPNQLEFDEHIEVLTLPWTQAIALISRGEIEDAKTIAGLMMAGLHLGILSNRDQT
jgi:ADP-ribose pyrophosphatase